MSVLRNNLPEKKPSEPVAGVPGGSRPPEKPPSSHDGHADSSADILSDHPEPTDDSPTIISKNQPKPAEAHASSNRDIQGRRLAHFELIEQIGVGGMAAVLRARDTQLDRFVALKILPPDMAADLENVQRFHQEARAAAKLDHENIARVFFCGEDQRLHFIAFEFVEGDNLRTILERRGRLPFTEALPYIIQIAAGLCHAAERGVVHRDIKPSNIIITPHGRAKLVDMGLARSLEPRSNKDLTHSGVTLGTFDYISPEQALEPREADVRSDIYSLGCTFYHMLTGHPPVPEGTAARKLHAHQHVKPQDPRELVPDLPDEVALILARMMAKRPGERYQTADDLVRHLLAVARQLGSTVEVPEGVLFVETAVPTPPDNRMLVLAGLAVAAVLALIFLTDFSGPTSATVSPRGLRPTPPEGGQGKDLTKESLKPTPSPLVPVVAEKGPKPVVDTVEYQSDNVNATDLASWLERNRNAPRLDIPLSGIITLERRQDTQNPGPGLKIAASREVILRAKNPAEPPTIRIIYPAPLPDINDLWTALTIDSPSIQLQGVRIEIDARASTTKMDGLLLHGQNCTIQGCQFIQAGPAPGGIDRQLASLVIEGSEPTRLSLNECCFLSYSSAEYPNDPDKPVKWLLNDADPRGQDAVVCHGSSLNLQADNCVFGPHTSLFRLKGTSGKESQLTLRHCSALMAGRSALFYLDDGVAASLDVRHSLFSRPGDPSEDGHAVLVRQTNNRGQVTYTGRDNRYHNLDAFWGCEQNPVEISMTDFPGQLRDKKLGQDGTSRQLTAFPWKNPQPLKGLEEPEPAFAFGLDGSQRELRRADDSLRPIGVERLLGVDFVKKLPKLEDPKPELVRKERIVWPGHDDSKDNIFPTLRKAVEDAKPGDVILIRHDGEMREVRVKPVRLEEATVDLTIRPDKGYRPILTLDDTPDLDAALFRLHDGKIRLENLEFRIQPRDVRFRSQVLVNLVGEGECELKDCLVTLDQGGHEAHLALAALPPAEGFMKSEPRPERPLGVPHLVLKNSVVRGQGHLIWSRAGRSLEVDVTNALVAVTGSFLLLEGAPENAPVSAGPTNLRLTQVTTYLGGHLIHCKDARGFPRVDCKPVDCLFLPPAGSGALVHLDGPETDTEKLKEKLIWSGGRNAYGSYTNLFDQKPPGEDNVMIAPLTADRWRMFAGESSMSKFKAKLINPPPQDFTRILPGHFKLMMDLTDFGLDPTKLGKLFPNADMP